MRDKANIQIGERFGRLIVLSLSHIRKSRRQFVCECSCGVTKTIDAYNLRYGISKSCGCAIKEAVRKRNMVHGDSKSPEHIAWMGMNSRCNSPTNKKYNDYGGRGIAVCERWLSYENFLSDMGRRPASKHSLDRKDVNGNYTPENCRWATHYEQTMNKRRHVGAKFKGIWWSTGNKSWAAQITKDGKCRHLGSFKTPEEAAAVYANAARELYGEAA